MSTRNDHEKNGAKFQGNNEARREFLQKAGMMTGGMALMGFPSWRTLPQSGSDCKPATVAAPKNCNPVPKPPATATPYVFDLSQPISGRKSIAELSQNQTEVQRLKNAFCQLRKLTKSNPQDPRGWYLQANVHCYNCGGPTASGLPEIHGSWTFMPWHRCYLFFLERILGKLVGDMSLRIPYWEWDVPTSRAVPGIYWPTTDPNNPLSDANRGATPSNMLPNSLVGSQVMDPIMNVSDYPEFMGGPDNAGQLEAGPHGDVHIWVGDPAMRRAKRDMGKLQTAAEDPLFFAHHCNIDRLWQVWMQSSPDHTLPPAQSDWWKLSWTFYDENSKWVKIAAADVVNPETNLRYNYPTGAAATAARAGARVAPQVAGSRQRQETRIAASRQRTRLGAEPLTQRIQLPSAARERILSQGVTSSNERPARVYVLRIEGIDLPANQSARILVFGNMPNATASTSTDSPNFLGTISIVAKGDSTGSHRHSPLNVNIDITRKVPNVLRDNNDLTVTLVPVAAPGSRPDNLNLTFQSIHIIERQ
jgi:polyphenol oxidase